MNGSSPRVRGTRTRTCPALSRRWFIPAGAGNAPAGQYQAMATAVHPRGCGERGGGGGIPLNPNGSSPRVRGTQILSGMARGQVRFIPAGAGNAAETPLLAGWPAVHPRGCGERARATSASATCSGSSPRVRGTLDAGLAGQHVARFIPAGAGNARFTVYLPAFHAVHPRGCGEREPQHGDLVLADGSSPRVRGTRVDVVKINGFQRFIPAGAGNATGTAAAPCRTAVHPRGCGERRAPAGGARRGGGSSPRVRGTRPEAGAAHTIRRFIPAGAGNAARSLGPISGCAVHPRGCGERRVSRSASVSRCGSSPRVRGTHSGTRPRRGPPRFIPAGAGNAPPSPPAGFAGAVHPRGCGERQTRAPAWRSHAGSSPRVRGTPACGFPLPVLRRFIPAGAGNASAGLGSARPSPVHPRGCGERAAPLRPRFALAGSSPRVRGTRQRKQGFVEQ